jgi:hypothetical protein
VFLSSSFFCSLYVNLQLVGFFLSLYIAFGAAVDEMLVLSDKNIQNIVEKHAKGDYTTIVHGKYGHEETGATASFAGKFICHCQESGRGMS